MSSFKILALLFFVSLSGCSTLNQSWKSDAFITKNNLENLEVGDIVITSKNWKKPMSWFGHSAIMVSKYKVGEYPELYYGYYETDIILWLSKKKDFTVLRYKKFNKKFKNLTFIPLVFATSSS